MLICGLLFEEIEACQFLGMVIETLFYFWWVVVPLYIGKEKLIPAPMAYKLQLLS